MTPELLLDRGYVSRFMDKICSKADRGSGREVEAIVLQSCLEASSISRFDNLVSKGEIIYKPSVGQIIQDEGFNVKSLGSGLVSVLMMAV